MNVMKGRGPFSFDRAVHEVWGSKTVGATNVSRIGRHSSVKSSRNTNFPAFFSNAKDHFGYISGNAFQLVGFLPQTTLATFQVMHSSWSDFFLQEIKEKLGRLGGTISTEVQDFV